MWSRYPVIYEINTWVWLNELSRKYGKTLTLATVPSEEWDYVSSLGVDAIWFMGVWERSPAGIGVAMQNQGLLEDFRRALPDFSAEDNIGSPYCVRRYVVDDHLGGPEGLAAARRILRERALGLILDFVPNHVAPDHPWVFDHPEYFIRGDKEDLRREPASFFEAGGNVFACGKDPYFPAWPDVLQLNAFEHGLRQAVIETVSSVAGQCDGIRCDMAMLMMNNIFERTWGARAGQKPDGDYWTTVIPAIKKEHPEFRFIAEAYWDKEWELQQQGFDFCYDKKLYDRLEHDNAESISLHLGADLGYQERMVRFIENHDEPRAAATFSSEKGRAAAVVAMTLTGARLLHEGQSQGRRVRLPVFLGRRPVEPVDQDLAAFYQRLLKGIDHDVFRNGQWSLCERSGWPDNQSYLNILSWCWSKDEERCLIIVNFSEGTVQAQVHVPWDELRGRTWRLADVLSGDTYDRSGDEMRDSGLYVDLGPWSFHFFSLNPLCHPQTPLHCLFSGDAASRAATLRAYRPMPGSALKP
ncbi:MAG: alpha-amylase [Nitrospirae bacterium]|nr:alpha-amylase [Nitrospirota bacterium]